MGAMAHVGCHWRASKVQKAGPQFGLVVPTGRQSACSDLSLPSVYVHAVG